MSPATSVAIMLLGGALFFTALRRYPGLAQVLCATTFLVGLLGLLRYLYGGMPLPAFLGMSVITALASVTLALGTIALTLHAGLLAQAFAEGPGLMLIRIALLPALVVPALIRWLLLNGHMAGWFSPSAGTAMFVVSATVVTVFFIFGIAIQLNRLDAERSKSDAATRRLAMIVESSDDAIISKDLQGRVTSWNRGAEAIFGYTAGEMLGTSIRRLFPADREYEEDVFLGAIARGESLRHYATRRITKQGETIDVSVTLSPIKDAAGNIVGASKVARDVTREKAQEREILRLSRLYAALSHVNQAIIAQHGRDQLFEKVCEAMIEFGGFSLAWIGLLDPETGRIRVANLRGAGPVAPGNPVAAPVVEGDHGWGGAEIREGRTYVCNQVAGETSGPDMQPTASEAGRSAPAPRTTPRRSRYNSLAALPLHQEGVVIGSINVYADEPGIFQDKEMALLDEAAADVSFALGKIARDVRHAEAEAAVLVSQQAIVHSEARYRTLFDYAPDGILIADQRSRYLDANLSMAAMLGYERDDLIGMQADDIVAPAELENVQPALRAIRSTKDYKQEWRLRRGDGSIFPTEVRVTEMPDGNLLAIIRDITERKHAERRIAAVARLYSVLSNINELIVRASDQATLLRDASRIAVEYGQFPLAWACEVRDGEAVFPLVAWTGGDVVYREKLEAAISRHLASDSPLMRTLIGSGVIVVDDIAADPRLFEGEAAVAAGYRSLVVLPFTVSGRIVAIFGICADQVGFFDEEEVTLLRKLADDISFALDHIEKARQLEYLAYYDPLTGLANRTLLLERLDQDIRSPGAGRRGITLFLMDLERFKNINDSFGQAAGDGLLRQVAEWLIHSVGDPARLARMGSDHFAVLIPSAEHGGEVARFLKHVIPAFHGKEFRVDGTAFNIGAKFGAAMFPDDGDNALALYGNAEAALKKAKSGGDRYLFYAERMTERIAGELAMENQLRRALENHQFVLHYQPKMDAFTGKLSGAEALLRWNCPGKGLVAPAEFIPVLEETGLIRDVGRWAIAQALEDYVRWRRNGLRAVRIAVNISSLQLRDEGFISDLEQALGRAGDASGGLELELTESLVMHDLDAGISHLAAIRNMGVTIAIDDFGTGFSSMGYLSRLPLDILKIDRSFVDAIESPHGRALVSTIINLAQSLGLGVVAEGVETQAQAALLRELGCGQLQGFLFSRPVPCAQFEERFLAAGA